MREPWRYQQCKVRMQNDALRKAGALVPKTFDEYPVLIADTYQSWFQEATLYPQLNQHPQDTNGLCLGQKSRFDSQTERLRFLHCRRKGEELQYAGMKLVTSFQMMWVLVVFSRCCGFETFATIRN